MGFEDLVDDLVDDLVVVDSNFGARLKSRTCGGCAALLSPGLGVGACSPLLHIYACM